MPETAKPPVVWSDAVAPGGAVCAVPMPSLPDGICGHPVESEPCPEHPVTAPMPPEDVPGDLVDDAVDVWHETPHLLLDDRMRAILAAVLPAVVPYGHVVVARADLDTKLNQRNNHGHLRPGIWDDSNAPEIAGKPCEECAAEGRLRAALGEQL